MSLIDIDAPPAQQRHAARQYWLEQQAHDHALTGRELGETFGRSERWGLERIKEAKATAEVESVSPAAAAERLPGEIELDGLDGLTETDARTEATDETDDNDEPDEAPIRDVTVTPHEPHAGPHATASKPHEPHAGPHATASEPHDEPHADREKLQSLIANPTVHGGAEKKPHATASKPHEPHAGPQGDRTPTAPHLQHKNKILKVFYVLVLTLALIGQTTAAAQWVPIGTGGPHEHWITLLTRGGIAGVFSLVLELGALVMLLETVSRAATGARSRALPLLGAFAFAGTAGAITFVGHWGPQRGDQLAAVAFLLVTLAGLVTLLIQMDWRVRPEHARRANVEKAVRAYVKQLDMPPADKEVLLSSVDADTIALRITNGLDNETIADRLAEAINPTNWKNS